MLIPNPDYVIQVLLCIGSFALTALVRLPKIVTILLAVLAIGIMSPCLAALISIHVHDMFIYGYGLPLLIFLILRILVWPAAGLVGGMMLRMARMILSRRNFDRPRILFVTGLIAALFACDRYSNAVLVQSQPPSPECLASNLSLKIGPTLISLPANVDTFLYTDSISHAASPWNFYNLGIYNDLKELCNRTKNSSAPLPITSFLISFDGIDSNEKDQNLALAKWLCRKSDTPSEELLCNSASYNRPPENLMPSM